MRILKFGGSSVADENTIARVTAIIKDSVSSQSTIVVVSALGGATDTLLLCARTAADSKEEYKELLQKFTQRHIQTATALLPLNNQSATLSKVMQLCNELEDILTGIFLLGELSLRTQDRVASYGELLSSLLLTAHLQAEGLQPCYKDARRLIITDSGFGKATVDFGATNNAITGSFSATEKRLYVVPGFIASDPRGCTTTLGRGGSDYTAAILGAALAAPEVEIWTDVSGLLTADPRLVPNARSIKHISFQEAMELSHFGAKVIFPPTLQPLMQQNIPVHIKNTFAPEEPGTVIQLEGVTNGSIIRGISSIGNMSLLSLEGTSMVGVPGFSKRLFDTLARHQINVVVITQASSEHTICVGVEEPYSPLAKEAVDREFESEIRDGKINPLQIEKDLSVVAVVGEHMKSHAGISGKMFSALGRNGINIRAIAQGSSERNITAVIASKDVRKAINVLHEDFFETTYRQVNLFIAGTGNVGSKLLQQIASQVGYLQQNSRLQIKLVGLSNSRTMVMDEKGISLNSWKAVLKEGEPANVENFIQKTVDLNLRNSIFVDMTASEVVATSYEALLRKSISVVACNKIACSAPYAHYARLKELAREFNTSFFYETNVGAGLPIIGTLNDLLRSGDRINRIEAVLSGTLNFVFNHYNGERSFSSVVKQAQEEGYTEPDPRLDLSGIDVMRKIMILVRESGTPLELTEINNRSFLPPSCTEGNVDQFYQAMEAEEAHFRSLYEEAARQGKKLKYVAQYAEGKASVGLRCVEPHHDFYNLQGKDNIVLFYTSRYKDQPLSIKGAGAGAEVTASGVFADIIRAAII